MGGYGFTRWYWHEKATTVGECLALPIWPFYDFIDTGTSECRYLRWNEEEPTVAFVVENRQIRLFYLVENIDDLIECWIELDKTRFGKGGQRWWFRCPACSRRCYTLYLAPGRIRFGCRECLGLTYRSCQRSHCYSMLDLLLAEEAGVPIKTAKRHWDELLAGPRPEIAVLAVAKT